MQQMYKVFINNHPIFICDVATPIVEFHGTIILRFDSELIIDFILEQAHLYDKYFTQFYLLADNPQEVFEKLKVRCKFILAAGGLVKNKEDQWLLIFRLGKWDLPKGKLENGETPEAAALREVEEECGIKKLSIIKSLTPTYHTYKHNEKIVLKKTFWYEMICLDPSNLHAQAEEGITEVRWMDLPAVQTALQNTYFSIVDVVKERLN